MTNGQHIEQTVVDACAGSDLHAAARLASIPDDCHGAAASDFAIRQDEPSVILMRIQRQNCTHHGVRGWAKQAFEFRRSRHCDLRAEAYAGCIEEPVLIGLTGIDCYVFTSHTQRQRLLWITRNAASVSEVVRGA